MLNLIIDIGNTLTKVGIFNHGELMLRFTLDEITPDNIRLLKQEYPALTKGIITTGKSYNEEVLTTLKNELDFAIELNSETLIPIANNYETPETLGNDRLAAAVGANKLYPNTNLLIIDAGTAITYDIVSNENAYIGGFIAPGLRMRFKALNKFTGKLPLIELPKEIQFSGKNTTEAITGGVYFGVIGEINYFISEFTNRYNNLIVFLTGGDEKIFDKFLKNHKFVTSEITLLGLNTILEYNYSFRKK